MSSDESQSKTTGEPLPNLDYADHARADDRHALPDPSGLPESDTGEGRRDRDSTFWRLPDGTEVDAITSGPLAGKVEIAGKLLSAENAQQLVLTIGKALRVLGASPVSAPTAEPGEGLIEAKEVRRSPAPTAEPEHETSDRGFKHYEPVDSRYGEKVRVYESSSATEASLWLSISGRVSVVGPLEPFTSILADPKGEAHADGNAAAHLTLEQAAEVRDRLDWMIRTHYQAEAAPAPTAKPEGERIVEVRADEVREGDEVRCSTGRYGGSPEGEWRRASRYDETGTPFYETHLALEGPLGSPAVYADSLVIVRRGAGTEGGEGEGRDWLADVREVLAVACDSEAIDLWLDRTNDPSDSSLLTRRTLIVEEGMGAEMLADAEAVVGRTLTEIRAASSLDAGDGEAGEQGRSRPQKGSTCACGHHEWDHEMDGADGGWCGRCSCTEFTPAPESSGEEAKR